MQIRVKTKILKAKTFEVSLFLENLLIQFVVIILFTLILTCCSGASESNE